MAEAPLEERVARRLAYRLRHSGKTCERCRKDKPLSSFSRDSRNRDGLRRYCRECDADAYKQRRVNAHSA